MSRFSAPCRLSGSNPLRNRILDGVSELLLASKTEQRSPLSDQRVATELRVYRCDQNAGTVVEQSETGGMVLML